MVATARFPVFVLLSVFAHGVALVSSKLPNTVTTLGDTAQPLRISLLKPAPITPPVTVATEQATVIPPREQQASATPVRAAVRTRTARHPQKITPLQTTVTKQPAPPATQARTTDQRQAKTPAKQPSLSSTQLRNRVSDALTRRLRAQFNYPWLARKRGWQGRVTLSLRVGENGHLSHIQVAQTSGHRILDNSALNSAARINDLSEVAGLMQGKSLELLIPVQYRLLDS